MSHTTLGLTALLCLVVLGPMEIPAQASGSGSTAPRPQVLILGSVHLRQRADDAPRINTVSIRQALEAFRPDQVVIEWLHPSIDPASTFNYRPLGDRATLARLWGYPIAGVPGALDSVRAALARLAPRPEYRAARGGLRREMARLLYLTGDEANAAYMWFLARREGVIDAEGERLTVRLLDGHEATEWGFAVAAASGLERITAFDFQGPDAGTLIWGEMLEAMRDSTLARMATPSRNDSTALQRAGREYDSLRTRLETQGDTAWVARYRSAPGVREYADVIAGFTWAQAQEPVERDGLTLMRWLQSREYEAVERRVQTELIPSIRFGGYGARRHAGIMARNRHMADYLAADAVRSGATKILVVVGAQHKYALEDILRERGYTIVDSRSAIPPIRSSGQ